MNRVRFGKCINSLQTELIVTDICGPMQVECLGGSRLFDVHR